MAKIRLRGEAKVVFRQFRDIVKAVVNGAIPHSARPREEAQVFHSQDTRPVVAPGLLHSSDFRRAMLYGGAFCGAFWLATAYLAVKLFLGL